MIYGNTDALLAAASRVRGGAFNPNSIAAKRNIIFIQTAEGTVISAALLTRDETLKRYPNDATKQDIFRHGLWSALLVEAIGAERAQIVTSAYEDETPNNTGLSRDMDIFNNKVGRDLAIGKTFNSLEQCGDMIVEAINQGKFRKIVDGKLVPSGNSEYSHLLKSTASYKANGGSKQLPVYTENLTTQMENSYITNGEVVTVKSIHNESAKIIYSTSNGDKEAYVPLSHLDGKEYIDLYIKQMKARYTPNLVNGWYTYDGWGISQYYNDLTSSDKYLGHLGIDIKNIKQPVARAVYPGKVHYAGISYSNGSRSANGYVVQIEHTYESSGIKKTFYSFYAHLRPDSINVKKDDLVKAGDIIGIMGHTTSVNDGGGMGDHIHLGIYTGSVSPQGGQYGYNRILNSEGKQTFNAPNGYYTYKGDTFYNPTLWNNILKLL